MGCCVRYDVALEPDSPVEVYHLIDDPGEAHNVASLYSEIARELTGLIKQACIPSDEPTFNFPKPNEQKVGTAH